MPTRLRDPVPFEGSTDGLIDGTTLLGEEREAASNPLLDRLDSRMLAAIPAAVPRSRNVFERIDDAIVPSMQKAAHAAANSVLRRAHRLDRWERGVFGGRLASSVSRHRGVMTFIAALLVFSASALHLTRFSDRELANRTPQNRPAASSTGSSAEVNQIAGGAVVVGPDFGVSLATYIGSHRDQVSQLAADERRYAVVSFTTYRSAAAASGAVRGSTVTEVQFRIQDELERPDHAAVPDNDVMAVVTAELIDARTRLEEERRELIRLRDDPELGDAAAEADFGRRVTELDAVLAELGRAGDQAAVVFAVVIEADGETLREIDARVDVRLVDVAPAETEPGASAFFGLLPEDTGPTTFGYLG